MITTNINTNIINGLQQIRAIYPHNTYVGGSFARHLVLPELGEFDDVDVFILGPRQSEPWVTLAMLRTVFDDVVNATYNTTNTDNPYQLQHQHGRYVCTLDGVTYDLIFLDDTINNLISEQTASSLSKFYFKITYGDPHSNSRAFLRIVDHAATRLAVGDLKISEKCILDESKASISHIAKIKKLCSQFGLHMHTIEVVHRIPTFWINGSDDTC